MKEIAGHIQALRENVESKKPKKQVGRPKTTDGKTVARNIDLPVGLIDDLSWLAKLQNKSQKKLISDILEKYVKDNQKILEPLKKLLK